MNGGEKTIKNLQTRTVMHRLVLLRHGQSTWNKENRFTGWTDVGLTEQGAKEARDAGGGMLEAGCSFDIAYTSVLKRAIQTLWIVLEEMDLAGALRTHLLVVLCQRR